jgi:hypothetical protein
LKIDPANVALVCASVLAWAVAGAIVTSEPFGGKGIAVAVGIGATTAFCAAARAGVAKIIAQLNANADRIEKMMDATADRMDKASDAHACRMEKVTDEHACRMEKATDAHAQILAKHGLTLEKVFGMGQRSDDLARMLARDSGPFRIVNGDG